MYLFTPIFLLAGELSVTFLDCGQGDAIVIQTPSGKTYLIDAGPNTKPYGGGYDAGERVVVPFLLSRDVEEIEAIVITHPHLDHYGGVLAVLENFPVKRILDSGISTRAPPYQKIIEQTKDVNMSLKTVLRGQTLNWGPEIQVEVLWPTKTILNKKTNERKDNLNDRSIVLKMTHGENSFLFPGDTEKLAETELVKFYGSSLESDVLKTPHHASKTSSTEEFLDAVNPRLAVISCSKHNRYGHPHPDVLDRLSENNISFYRTDKDGSVEVFSDGETLSAVLLK